MFDKRNFKKMISNKKAQRKYALDGDALFEAAVRLGAKAAESVDGSFDVELIDNYTLVANYNKNTDKVIVSFWGDNGEVIAIQK